MKNKKSAASSMILGVAFICCVADFGIAQFGLLTLIQKAYSVLAYLAIPAVTRFDTK